MRLPSFCAVILCLDLLLSPAAMAESPVYIRTALGPAIADDITLGDDFDGEKLTGTVKRASGDAPLTGTVKGDSVRFSYTIKYGDNELAVTIAAKVTGGTAMKGTVDFAGQVQESFEAKKVSAASAVAKLEGVSTPM